MFHEDSFSLDSFSTDSWLFLLEVPYFELTGKQRVYVRHALQSVYAMDVAERIVAVAEHHNLSAVDSVEVIRAQIGDQTLFVLPRKRIASEKSQHKANPVAQKQAKETRVAYATSSTEAIYAMAAQLRVFADFHAAQSIVSGHAPEILFVINKPERAAHNSL